MMFLPTAASVTITSDANQWAMCLGESAADGLTWANPMHQDAAGNLYVVRSLWVTPEWINAAQQTPQRPVWDTENSVNMAGARRAFDALTLWTTDSETAPPQAQPGRIVALQGLDIDAAITALGLTLISEEVTP